MDIASRLKELRIEHNLSMNELSRRSGVAQSFITYIEAGDRQPTLESLIKICSGLGISLIEFLGDDVEANSLPAHLRELLSSARYLTPEQVDQLTKFIQSLKSE